MFMRVLRVGFVTGLALMGGVSLVQARATLNGACDAPIADHQCVNVAGVSSSDRTARDCQSGHCVGLGDDVLCCRAATGGTAATPPVSDACGATITAMATRPPALADVQASWTCRIPPAGPEGERQCRDFDGCHTPNPAGRCCPPNVGTAIGRAAAGGMRASAQTSAAPAPSGGLAGRLGLPDCATTHDPQTAGKCTLENIKTVAVNFANFLMGLAAACFLGIFVWAGFRYIFFAYDPGVAGESRKTLTNAAIGMLLVLGAATIVRFTQTVVTGRAPKEDRCVAQRGSTYSCQNTSRMSVAERRNCVDNLCDGTNIKCCPTAASGTPTTGTPAPTTPATGSGASGGSR